jgi:hypothetical protein
MRVGVPPAPGEHWSDCAVNNGPALPIGPCDCGANMDVEARDHHPFSASQAHRYLACPGSVSLIERIPPEELPPSGGGAASRGTAKHAVVEMCLTTGHPATRFLNKEVVVEGVPILITTDDVEAIQLCLDTIQPLIDEGYEITLERRVTPTLDLPIRAPTGLADVIAFHRLLGEVIIVDWKFGQIPVEVKENPQFLFYAAGALAWLVAQGEVATHVETWVVQPETPEPVRKAAYSSNEVLMWSGLVLQGGIARALDDDAPLYAGTHCTFCPARVHCPELQRLNQALTRAQFIEAETPLVPIDLPSAKLAQLLDEATVVEMFIDALKAEAQRRLEAHKPVPGWRLVPKRATRKWADKVATIDALTRAGIAASHYTETALLSPAQLEKQHPETYGIAAKLGLVVKESSGFNLAKADPKAGFITDET